MVSKKFPTKFGTYNKLGSWLLCRGDRGVVRKKQDFFQMALDLAKQFTLYFEICSSKLLPLKVITRSKQINLNIPWVLEGVQCRALNAPRER